MDPGHGPLVPHRHHGRRAHPAARLRRPRRHHHADPGRSLGERRAVRRPARRPDAAQPLLGHRLRPHGRPQPGHRAHPRGRDRVWSPSTAAGPSSAARSPASLVAVCLGPKQPAAASAP
ncbi:hypothetical protein G5V59_20200 [Nocardioides sp. W3-2-3]|nr:hypothetical protein [Nocardioides convexus]